MQLQRRFESQTLLPAQTRGTNEEEPLIEDDDSDEEFEVADGSSSSSSDDSDDDVAQAIAESPKQHSQRSTGEPVSPTITARNCSAADGAALEIPDGKVRSPETVSPTNKPRSLSGFLSRLSGSYRKTSVEGAPSTTTAAAAAANGIAVIRRGSGSSLAAIIRKGSGSNLAAAIIRKGSGSNLAAIRKGSGSNLAAISNAGGKLSSLISEKSAQRRNMQRPATDPTLPCTAPGAAALLAQPPKTACSPIVCLDHHSETLRRLCFRSTIDSNLTIYENIRALSLCV